MKATLLAALLLLVVASCHADWDDIYKDGQFNAKAYLKDMLEKATTQEDVSQSTKDAAKDLLGYLDGEEPDIALAFTKTADLMKAEPVAENMVPMRNLSVALLEMIAKKLEDGETIDEESHEKMIMELMATHMGGDNE